MWHKTTDHEGLAIAPPATIAGFTSPATTTTAASAGAATPLGTARGRAPVATGGLTPLDRSTLRSLERLPTAWPLLANLRTLTPLGSLWRFNATASRLGARFGATIATLLLALALRLTLLLWLLALRLLLQLALLLLALIGLTSRLASSRRLTRLDALCWTLALRLSTSLQLLTALLILALEVLTPLRILLLELLDPLTWLILALLEILAALIEVPLIAALGLIASLNPLARFATVATLLLPLLEFLPLAFCPIGQIATLAAFLTTTLKILYGEIPLAST